MYVPPPSNIDRINDRWNNHINENVINIDCEPFSFYERTCSIVEFFKNNPGAQSALISCNCPRCTVWC